MKTKTKSRFLRYSIGFASVFVAVVLLLIVLRVSAADITVNIPDLGVTYGGTASTSGISTTGFTASIKGKSGGNCQDDEQQSDEITFTNNTGATAKISFDYTVSFGSSRPNTKGYVTVNGTRYQNSGGSGNVETSLEAGKTIKIVMQSDQSDSDSAVTTVKVSNLKFYYTITWQNDDGSKIDTTMVEYNKVPTHADATKAATAQYTYTFTGWNPTPVAAKGAKTYKATFSETVNKYTITWLNDDGSEIDTTEVEYGTVPTHDDPTKAATAEYTYTFAGWDTTPVAVTGNATYKATYTATKNKYTITWLNDDGSEIDTTEVEYGTVPTHDDPTKASTAQYDYTFAGWDTTPVAVTGNATYKATFTPVLRQYKVTWDNQGAVREDTVDYGNTPSYGSTPTKAATAQYTYTFAGWSDGTTTYDPGAALPTVTGDVTYTATFSETVNKYTITWLNDDDTLIDTTEVEYGTVPTHADPTKASTAQYDYTFSGWDTTPVAVTGNATYKATFTPVLRQYKVKWDNQGVEREDTLDYGSTPSYGSTPTKAATAQYTYTFAGWSDGTTTYDPGAALPTVTGDVTYTATFSETVNKYTVTWKNGNDVIETDTEVEYGALPHYDGADPTKADDEQYTYTFSGWNDGTKDYALNEALPTVTGDVTFTANFTAKKLFVGQTITLESDIVINFYIDPAAAGVDINDVVNGDATIDVKFSWVTTPAPKSKVSNYNTVISKDNYTRKGNYLMVSCKVCAAEMSCVVKATATVGDTSKSKTYSVREYGETVLDPNSEFSVDYKEKNGEQKYNDLVDLIEKTLDYGTKAQNVFKINVSDPANSIVTGYTMGDVTAEMINDAIYAANKKYADDMNTVADALGAKYYGSSLFYLSNNTIRHIFTKKTAAFNPNDYDGNQYNYYYYVQKGDIPAAKLDLLQEFTVGSVKFYYSPLDYAKSVIDSGMSQNEKDLAKSLYWYNQAAKKYFP